MEYDGYARFWLILGAVSIGCNLWTPGPDLAIQDVVMENQFHKMWKQFHRLIPSHSPRRRIYEPEARAGLNREPLSLGIYFNIEIGYFSGRGILRRLLSASIHTYSDI